ncbi:hypothetical protein C8F04DRAFT_1129884, partial [Mycena alexandri]
SLARIGRLSTSANHEHSRLPRSRHQTAHLPHDQKLVLFVPPSLNRRANYLSSVAGCSRLPPATSISSTATCRSTPAPPLACTAHPLRKKPLLPPLPRPCSAGFLLSALAPGRILGRTYTINSTPGARHGRSPPRACHLLAARSLRRSRCHPTQCLCRPLSRKRHAAPAPWRHLQHLQPWSPVAFVASPCCNVPRRNPCDSRSSSPARRSSLLCALRTALGSKNSAHSTPTRTPTAFPHRQC